MLVPLNIPPGVYTNGTEYQSKGRNFDANLVRWQFGALGPMGGWRQKNNYNCKRQGKTCYILA